MQARRSEEIRGKDAPSAASIGPRSCKRGGVEARHAQCSPDPRFNRAALLQARRCRRRAAVRRGDPRFNRAALLQARRSRTATCRFSRLRCFNRAALLQARRYLDAVRPRGKRRASIGPRSCKRGGRAAARVGAGARVGFNRAALLQARRSRNARRSAARRRCSFNRAALLQARRSGCPSPRLSPPNRFNRAALLQARRCGSKNLHRHSAKKLQ